MVYGLCFFELENKFFFKCLLYRNFTLKFKSKLILIEALFHTQSYINSILLCFDDTKVMLIWMREMKERGQIKQRKLQ